MSHPKDSAVAYMESHFPHAPAAAKAVYLKAKSARHSAASRIAAIRRAQTPAPTTEPKGLAPMPATANGAAHRSTWQPDPVSVGPSTPYVAPRYLNSTVTGIAGPDGYQRIYAAQMALAAAVGRKVNNRCDAAERYLTRNAIRPLNIATTAEATAGGYLVPDELAALIIEKEGPTMSRRVPTWLPIGSSTTSVPIEVGGLTVHYTAETAALTESAETFGMASFTTAKRTVFAKISGELLSDAGFAMVDRFTTRAAYAFSKQRDNELLNADGTSTYGGEVGLLAAIGSAGVVDAAIGHDTWPELDLDDFGAVMAKPASDYLNGEESWICSPQFYYMAMLPAAGGAAQGFAPDGRPLFMSRPVNFTMAMPTTATAATACCMFGNFAEAVLVGDRSIVFNFSDQAPGCFDRGLVALKATARYDINVHAGGDGSSAGAYAVLKTAS